MPMLIAKMSATLRLESLAHRPFSSVARDLQFAIDRSGTLLDMTFLRRYFHDFCVLGIVAGFVKDGSLSIGKLIQSMQEFQERLI